MSRRKNKLPAVAKPRMPANAKAAADKALSRHAKRSVHPKFELSGDIEGEGVRFDSPYSPEDRESWEAHVFQAFGTRSIPVAQYFCSQLARMCSRVSAWDGEGDDATHRWVPDEQEFNAILAIVNSTKPRDESQAALAVSLCATHLAAVRLAQRTIHYPDPRSVAVMNKTVRTYGDGLEQLQRIQGKRRKVQQVITVKTRIEKHEHQHIHYEGNGSNGAGVIEASTTVPGQEQAHGQPLSIASGEGPPRLPRPRRRAGNRGPSRGG